MLVIEVEFNVLDPFPREVVNMNQAKRLYIDDPSEEEVSVEDLAIVV